MSGAAGSHDAGPAIRERDGEVELAVHVQPRAGRSEVVGVHAGRLKVRLAAPPVEGAANEELVRLLARTLGVAPSDVTITRGHGARLKTVRVRGVSAERARRALGV